MEKFMQLITKFSTFSLSCVFAMKNIHSVCIEIKIDKHKCEIVKVFHIENMYGERQSFFAHNSATLADSMWFVGVLKRSVFCE